MSYSTIVKQSAALLGVLVILISVTATGFAGSTAGSTSGTVQTTQADISSANITYTTYAENNSGTFTVTVAFAQDITQEGTPSEIMNAFDIGQNDAALTYDADNPGSHVTVDEANDQIIFTVTESGDINSETDFSTGSNDGLQYDGSAGNNPLYADGTALSDFNQTLTNNVVPVIDAGALSYNGLSNLIVTSDNPDNLNIFFSEDIKITSEQDAIDAFGFTGNDAPTITGADSLSQSASAVNLSFQNAVDPGDNLGKLTYDGSNAVEGETSGVAAQEPDIDLTVKNDVSAPPEIQQVVFDDVPENTDEDPTGEMLLYFDSNVDAQKDGGNDTSGLTFSSDSTSVSINVDGVITDDYHEQPDNVIAVKFSSASGSVASLVREGDTFGSNAELSVNSSKGIDISYNGTGNDIASTNVPAENISNEIAGNLSEVNKTSSDIEILGADIDEQGTYNVTVSGLSDGEHQVLDESISVTVAGASTKVPVKTVEKKFRFDNEYTVSLPSDGSVDSNIGETVPINVTNESGTELQPNTAATVEIAHEARVTTEPTSDTFIISMPQPGDIVADSDIGAINSYNATSGEMESYADMDKTDRLHRGIFIDGNGTGNVYGFTYETETAGVGGTTATMPTGWNVVGSNAALSDTFPITYDEDLGFGTSPSVSSPDVRIWAGNNVGSNNVSTKIETSVDHNDSGVNKYDVYYVYMHESSDRVIIEPTYSSGS